jgi:catalase
VVEGADQASLQELHAGLMEAGAIPRYVGPKLGRIGDIDVEVSLEAAPSVLFDAVVIPHGEASAALAALGHAVEFVKDQYRHCKPILALGSGEQMLDRADIPSKLPDGKPDPGVLRIADVEDALPAFVDAIAKHRHFDRQTDPPRV